MFGLVLALKRVLRTVLSIIRLLWEVLKETMLVLTVLTLWTTLPNLEQYTRARTRAAGPMVERIRWKVGMV